MLIEGTQSRRVSGARGMNNSPYSRWDDPGVISHLKTLWHAGVPTVQIALAIGVSKNSIIGKAHRLNLPGRPSPIKAARPDSERTLIRVRSKNKQGALPVLDCLQHTCEPVQTATVVAAAPVGRVEACLWPCGVQSGAYRQWNACGSMSLPGRPYCPEHAAIAFVATPMRQDVVPRP